MLLGEFENGLPTIIYGIHDLRGYVKRSRMSPAGEPNTSGPIDGTKTVTRLQCATSTANSRKAAEVRNCSTDEGRPLGTGLQEQVPNHLRRLCSKGKVVNTEGKGLEFAGSGNRQEEDRKGTTVEVSKRNLGDVQNRGRVTTAG